MTELMLGVTVASLLGSLHCVGMCGGFVAFYASETKMGVTPWGAHAAYNFGRLFAYVVLGAVAGALGAAVNVAGSASGISQLAAVACGVLIIVWGAVMLANTAGLRSGRLPVPSWVNAAIGWVLVRLRAAPVAVRAGALGVSSALLPCGWLYAFVVTAAGMGRPETGAAVMLAFWLGTVPAMVGVGLGAQHFGRALGPRLGWLMPITLIVVGLLTVVHRGSMDMCHEPMAELQVMP